LNTSESALRPIGNESLVTKRIEYLTFVSAGEIATLGLIPPFHIRLDRIPLVQDLLKKRIEPIFIKSDILPSVSLKELPAELIVGHDAPESINANYSARTQEHSV
jgi:hypothetical protein